MYHSLPRRRAAERPVRWAAELKLYEIRDDQNRVIAFEISNLFISRRRVCRVVERIAGARITTRPKFLSWSRQDVFCEFELDGASFQIEEPYGDNSRYWVGRKPPGWHEAFAK